jgi:glycosyltransferase involved in cell wall biosynthesis
MRIAFLIPTIDRIGGAEQQVLLLAKGLARRNWHVTVIALSGSGGSSAQSLLSENVRFFSLHMRKGLADPRGWIQLHRWIKHHQPDVLHAHLPHAVLLARWLRYLAPVRAMVETIHSPAAGTILRKIAYCPSTSQPDIVTSVSQAAAEPWLHARMIRSSALAVIPNGIDLHHWRKDRAARNSVRRQLDLGDQFVWLAVGRLDPVKDHDTLLRAFATVPQAAQLLVAGAGPCEGRLRCLASELHISERVRFLGFQPDVLPWMQAADAFALSSRWEGLPMALLEAAACELPAAVSDLPATRNLFSPSLFVPRSPVGDANALAAVMNAMMRLPELQRAHIGAAMRLSVTENYGLASVLDQWEALYTSLLNSKPQPTRIGLAASSFDARTLQLQ